MFLRIIRNYFTQNRQLEASSAQRVNIARTVGIEPTHSVLETKSPNPWDIGTHFVEPVGVEPTLLGLQPSASPRLLKFQTMTMVDYIFSSSLALMSISTTYFYIIICTRGKNRTYIFNRYLYPPYQRGGLRAHVG